MERMQGFMDEPEREGLSTITSDTGPSNDPSPPPPLILKDCTYAWPGSTVPVLHGVNLTIETGLTVVYGKIGAGKTAFLHAILGEMDQLDGEYDVPDETMAYCAQTPWLQSLSIRDNILFFTPYEEERYNKVLEACQLLTDLASFKEGDESHIGEK
jgi:ABC-type multidrug transport system fused ATPase/permease subunit